MQLLLFFTLSFIEIHYMFWPNWPSSRVQVGLKMELLLPWVICLGWYCAVHRRKSIQKARSTQCNRILQYDIMKFQCIYEIYVILR
jgi:hypothetical protein